MWRGFTTLQVGRERERQKQRERGAEEEQKRDGSGKEEQTGLNNLPGTVTFAYQQSTHINHTEMAGTAVRVFTCLAHRRGCRGRL